MIDKQLQQNGTAWHFVDAASSRSWKQQKRWRQLSQAEGLFDYDWLCFEDFAVVVELRQNPKFGFCDLGHVDRPVKKSEYPTTGFHFVEPQSRARPLGADIRWTASRRYKFVQGAGEIFRRYITFCSSAGIGSYIQVFRSPSALPDADKALIPHVGGVVLAAWSIIHAKAKTHDNAPNVVNGSIRNNPPPNQLPRDVLHSVTL